MLDPAVSHPSFRMPPPPISPVQFGVTSFPKSPKGRRQLTEAPTDSTDGFGTRLIGMRKGIGTEVDFRI